MMVRSPHTVQPHKSRPFQVFGQAVQTPEVPPGLYLVATPIGNLGDVTLRALETLGAVEAIACEDSRITRRLLDRYAITTPLLTYHDHNAEAVRPKILARLAAGAAIALVSDAGTPLISDPGFKLVQAAQVAGHAVIAVPGPSAVLAALTASGLPTDRFFFEGFLPSREAGRRARIDELASLPVTLIFFETGPRIAAMLDDVAARLGGRPAAVCRELTKLHEEIRRGEVTALARAYRDGAETRGEFVVVIGPPAKSERVEVIDLDGMLKRALETASLKDAVEAVAAATGQKRRIVYQRALALPRQDADEPK
ncbi:MAG TPA: 16S rRNA (cytidine(1402)-2'-O)-methyltransferase [Xanthobacteraceae bacterium]|nr:16S rRNA (cytidine(1402)-2'-O)-methyltransferase [Xanthobacteraceae bacterium]